MISKICKWIVFKCIYPIVYFVGSRRNIREHKIVFVENHENCLSDNYTLLFDELKKMEYDLKVHYLKISSSSWGVIIVRTLKLIWDLSTAKCVFLNESNSVFGAFTFRKETRLIQLWHACGAFKKWGYSVADKGFGDDRKNLDKYSGHRNYDLVSVSGEAVCWAYEEAFGLQDKPGIVKALGVSRTDVYFSDERRSQAFEKLQGLDSWINGHKIILYAPTFRGSIRNAKSPDVLDLQVLSQIKDEYVILVKQHPFVKKGFVVPDGYKDFCVEITAQMNIEDLLIVSDICITDYSSIVFEYSLLNKPIMFFAYDLEEYYDERGFYYPYEEFVPGPIVSTAEELVESIVKIDSYDMSQLDRFTKEYMSGCDGHSTERILRYALQ